MKRKNYQYQMNLKTLNILSIIILFICLLISYLIDKKFLIYSFDYLYGNYKHLGLFFVYFTIYIIIHEILHSIAYVLYGGKYKNIEYGMELEKGIFYCLCKQDINKKNILNSLMFPLFYIGIITYIISLIYKLPMLHILSISNIMGAVGDIIMFIFIIKLDKDILFTEINDSTSFVIKSKKDLTKLNHFGLNYIGITNDIERTRNKKINISKYSLIFIILILIIFIFCAH